MKHQIPSQSETRIELAVPGADAHLGVIRTVVGRAAMIAGFSFDGIEDLALAVHEASALLLIGAPVRLVMNLWSEDEVLIVELRAEPGDAVWPATGFTDDVRWNLLGALCDRVWSLEAGVGIGLAQAKR